MKETCEKGYTHGAEYRWRDIHVEGHAHGATYTR